MNQDQASVFVLLYSGGKVISVPITKLSYMYSSKDSDTSQVDIESGDSSILDIPELQNLQEITIHWGYIGGKTKKRIVTILDRVEELTPQGVCLNLICVPKGFSLKQDQSDAVHKGTFDEVAGKVANEHGLTYVNKSNTKDPITKSLEEVSGYTKVVGDSYGTNVVDNGPGDDYSVVGIRKPGELESDNYYKAGVDNTSAPKFVRTFVAGNKSSLAMLNDEVQKEPGGPWSMVVRDDKLIKEKTDTSQTPFRSYTWKGGDGEMLSFRYSTKNKENMKDASKVETSGWDTVNKTFVKTEATSENDKSPRLGKNEPVAKRGGVENTGLPLQKTDSGPVYNKAGDTYIKNDKFGDFKLPKEEPSELQQKVNNSPVALSDSGEKPLWNPRASERADGSGTTYVQIDAKLSYTANGFGPEGQIRGDIDNTGVPLKAIYHDYKRKFSLPGDPESNGDEGLNKRKEANMELNNAQMSVLGNPDIESHQITTLFGVGKKNSGNWYIIKSTHVIEPGTGYITNCVLNRNGVDSDDIGGNFSESSNTQNSKPNTKTDDRNWFQKMMYDKPE